MLTKIKPAAVGDRMFDTKSLVRLIVPLAIEQFLLMSVGMVDTVMVASAGEAAVSGVSLVDNINLLLINIFSALSTGGAVVVSQYIGRRDNDNAKNSAKQLIYTAIILSLTLTAIALIFRRQILTLLFGKIETDVMKSAMVYFLTTAMAYPFMSIYNAGAALFRSTGNSKVSMFNSLVVNVVNIIVNAILIYGYNMGALGAGIGTLSSRVVAAVLILFLWQRKSNSYRIYKLFRPQFNGGMVRKILSIGIPNGLENGMFQLGRIIILSLVTTFGTTAVAANAISGSICGVLNVPGMAVGLAMLTVIGQCMGAQRIEDAVFFSKRLLLAVYISMGTMCMILFFTAPFIVSVFNLSPAASELSVTLLRCSATFSVIFWPPSFSLPNILRASGDVIFPMIVAFASMFICRLCLSYVFGCDWGFGLGVLGIWFAMFADWTVRAIFFFVRFKKGKWKTKKVI